MPAAPRKAAKTAPPKILTRNAVPKAELERRWKDVRREMKERKLDVLILQNSSPIFQGYVRWFTDVHVHSHPTTVIFPLEDEMTLISHGAKQTPDSVPFGGPVFGVKKQLTLPFLNDYNYSITWPAELAMTELKKYRGARIGFVGPAFISYPFYNYVTGKLKTAKFENASEWIDVLKAVKSEEEINDLRVCCMMQDDIFDYILTIVKPGISAREIRGAIIGKWLAWGGEECSVGVNTAPFGKSIRPGYPADRPIAAGDTVVTLVETSGPAGQWAEFCRTICLGKVSPELKEQFAVSQEVQALVLKAMKPGAVPEELWNAANALTVKRGFAEERRIFAHGQGYDMMERPSLNPGETMILQPNMNIAVHPEVKSPAAVGWVCENYLVKSRGAPELLHKTPQKIFVI